MPTENVDTSDLQKILDLVVRIDERQQAMGTKVDRVDKAIYGNGQPGLNTAVVDIQRRLELVENREAACPIEEMVRQMADMQTRHKQEDETAKERKADEKEEAKERRKGYREFKWGLASTSFFLVVDIVLRFFNIIK